jgi:hypothetical protein
LTGERVVGVTRFEVLARGRLECRHVVRATTALSSPARCRKRQVSNARGNDP